MATRSMLVVMCCFALLESSLGAMKYVDLSHSLNSQTHHWPANKDFEQTVIANGTSPNGGWYANNDMSLGEHTGTHLDAPAHFAMNKDVFYASTIPVERLVRPLSIINLADKAVADRDYYATAHDILEWERRYGMIPRGGIVIFNYEWAKHWNSHDDIFGSNSFDPSTFHFPGVGLCAARVLAIRGVYGVGIDTPSMDYGQSEGSPVHKYLMERNVFFLELVGDMSALPDGGKGVTLMVGAMKIDGGTGGPVRLIAMFDDAE
ncbi:isatin hydrolase-like [Watersipora subatra]|uniref:isatin hydrolase-like n=1 Tax=Watersipora subatra TaxID=2589382 RepID=UPI00355B808B